MERRLAIGGGLLVGLGLVVGLAWFVGRASPERNGSTVAPAGEGSGEEVVDSVAELRSSEPTPSPGEIAFAAEEGSSRTAVAESSSPNDLELRFVGLDGATVGRAKVLLLAEASERDVAAFEDLETIDDWMREHGEERVASSTGTLRVATPVRTPTLVLATHDDRWGRATLDLAAEGPVEIELRRDATLRVQTVDRHANPLPGVEVALLKRWSFASGIYRVWVLETRGANAVACFPHAQERILNRAGFAWSVGAEVLEVEPVEERIDPEALPRDPVILVVPATGSVEVSVLDELGDPLAGEAKVTIGVVRKGEARRLPSNTRDLRPALEKPLENSRALFPHVGLGCELEVIASSAGTMVSTRTYGAGPFRAGEKVSFELRLGLDYPVLRFRALDERGAPIVEEELHVTLHHEAIAMSSDRPFTVRTDEHGVARIDLERRWTKDMTRVLLLTRNSKEPTEQMAQVDIGREFAPGAHDLGDVVLEPTVLLVRGRVVSESGTPIPGARLTVEAAPADSDALVFRQTLRGEADEQGRFEFRDHSRGKALRLDAAASGWLTKKQRFLPGEEDLVIRLQAEGAIAGRVLLDEGIRPGNLRLRVEPSPDSRARRVMNGTGALPDGSFRIGGLFPGRYDLFLEGGAGGPRVFEVEGVLVQSGETTRDPRLDPIDLRGILYEHRVTLVLPDDALPPSSHMLECRPSVGKGRASMIFWAGEAHLITTWPHIDFEIDLPPYRAEKIEHASGDIEVLLRLGYPVRIVLRGDAELPDPPLFLKATLKLPHARNMDLEGPAFDEHRELLLRVPEPGRLKVTWIIERSTAGSSLAMVVDIRPEQYVEVLDVEGEQTVEITLTPEQLSSLLDGFQEGF